MLFRSVDRVGGAVVGLHVRHPELSGNRFVEDELGERLGGLKIDVI